MVLAEQSKAGVGDNGSKQIEAGVGDNGSNKPGWSCRFPFRAVCPVVVLAAERGAADSVAVA
jgi:hypothetical protein